MKKQIKVAYFPSDTEKNKVLGSNGKSLDKYCIKCETDEDLSTSNYIADLTFLIADNIQDILQEEVIIKVLMDYGYEIFRISKVTKGTRYVDVVARQITIADSLTLWLEDVRPTNLNGQGAVTWMLDKAEGKKEIEIISDIETTATAYYQRMSLYKALHDNDNSFLKRWGGEVQRRGYTVYINKRIGIDRGVTIREGKNLTGFDSTSNIDNLVTRARGEGYNGILGNYIDSPLIDKYNRIYTSVIKYDDVKVKDENNTEGFDTEEEAIAELDRRISEEYSKNSIDKIKASYNINFVQLEKTEQYKNYIIAERVYIGDTTRVYIPRLKVNIKVRSMIKKYDVLAQKTKEIKLSNYIEAKSISIKQIVDRLNNIDSTDTILQQAKDSASLLIKSGLRNSHVIVRENEILIMDTKDINTATKVWRWNNQGLGFSSTGYNGTYGTAITNDGQIVADFITTGILNAGLIKTGLLKSFNGTSWINMEDGTFSYGNGALKFDGANLSMETTDGTHGTKMSDGTLEFKVTGEVVGGVVATRYSSNKLINGFNIANTKNGDYVDIGKTDSVDFRGGSTFTPILRISNTVHELLGNFKGIQLLENTRMKNGKILFFESSDNNNPHEVYNALGSFLTLMGDNGMMLGYKVGEEKVKVLEIAETPNAEGNQVFIYKPLSMYGNTIKFVSDIYTGNTGGRYYHPGWCGSIEKVAKRVSNLNVSYDSGWYAFSRGTNGAPCDYGTLLHLKWGGEDPTDCTQLCIEVNTGRLFTRSTINNGAYWSSWVEK